MKYMHTAYLMARLGIGVSMITHGLIRIPKLEKFSKWMPGQFENSILPEILVKPFSYALPFFEFIIGLTLILGWFTRSCLISGSILLLMLLFGTGMIENWEAIPSQLIHVAFFSVLLVFIQYNRYSVDYQWNKFHLQ